MESEYCTHTLQLWRFARTREHNVCLRGGLSVHSTQSVGRLRIKRTSTHTHSLWLRNANAIHPTMHAHKTAHTAHTYANDDNKKKKRAHVPRTSERERDIHTSKQLFMHSIVCSIIVSWRQMRSSSSQPSSLPSHNDVHNLRYTNYSTHSHTHTHFNRNYEFHPHFTQRAHNANCMRTEHNRTYTHGGSICLHSVVESRSANRVIPATGVFSPVCYQ